MYFIARTGRCFGDVDTLLMLQRAAYHYCHRVCITAVRSDHGRFIVSCAPN